MIAMYHSLHQAQKKSADGDCKLTVETLQDSNLSSESVSKFVGRIVFTFKYISDSLRSCTDWQNIQSHCFNSLTSISVNFWALSVPHQVNARQFYLLPIPGTTFPESFQVVGMS